MEIKIQIDTMISNEWKKQDLYKELRNNGFETKEAFVLADAIIIGKPQVKEFIISYYDFKGHERMEIIIKELENEYKQCKC